MRHLFGLLASLVCVAPVLAQPVPPQAVTPGAYVDHRTDGNVILVKGEGASARVTFYRPSVVRVDWLPPGETPDSSFAVVRSPDREWKPTVTMGRRRSGFAPGR